MGKKYHPEPNYICDRMGTKHPQSQMVEQWDGLLVHKDNWEKRQPQDFINPIRTPKAVTNARADSTPNFAATIPDATILRITEGGEARITEDGLYYRIIE